MSYTFFTDRDLGKQFGAELRRAGIAVEMPKGIRFLRERNRPFIAKMYRPSPVTVVDAGKPGRIELWLSLADGEASQR